MKVNLTGVDSLRTLAAGVVLSRDMDSRLEVTGTLKIDTLQRRAKN